MMINTDEDVVFRLTQTNPRLIAQLLTTPDLSTGNVLVMISNEQIPNSSHNAVPPLYDSLDWEQDVEHVLKLLTGCRWQVSVLDDVPTHNNKGIYYSIVDLDVNKENE